jgi:hypothetical protein
MVLVKPATVVQWHRKGFRLYWRWRSRRLGRPKMSAEIRDLIRRVSLANPLWGAPRIHGELLKLGIEVSQATVGRYLPWRPKIPSPTWRSFLHNHLTDIAAIDTFVVATATFRLLYALIVLGHDRRRIIHFNVTHNPTQAWLAHQMTEAFPWACAASCRHIFNIITKPERISRSTKIAPRRAQYTRQPLARSLPFRRSVACIIATNVAPREPFRQPNRRHVSAWEPFHFITVSLGCTGAQNPCMVPRSQQRPMFYSTNQNSSVVSSANQFPDRIDF